MATSARAAGWAPPSRARRRGVQVGVDVVDVARFARVLALRGPDLCVRVFTAAEVTACAGSVPRLAARLAAKEAAAKALGTGIGPIGWRDVEVRTGASGAPRLHLRGPARAVARRRHVTSWAVSLAHDPRSAVAVVVGAGPGWDGRRP